MDAATRVPSAGEELGPRRRTNRLDEEPLESRAIPRQGVDTGRPQVGITAEAQVAPTLIVGEEDEDVGPSRGCDP